MYVQNDKGEYELKTTKEFPLSDYKLNTEKSSCKKGGVLSQDKRTNTVNVEVKSNDECNVYFDKETLSQRTLRILGLNYKENENINFFEPEVMDVTKDGLYSMGDDYGTSYYFRGAVENNYIKFGKNKDGQDMWWRIIRINGDGSLRIQYDGIQAWANGVANNSRVAISDVRWNQNYDDVKYVGWMFGGAQGVESISKEEAQRNETDSNAKKILDEWYELNIKNTGYSQYLEDSIFCNDRSIPGKEYTKFRYDTELGYGKNLTAFGSTARIGIWGGTTPIRFSCVQDNDKFTVDSYKGNGNLKYPVGLITADEVSAAGGGKYNSLNSQFYLYKGISYFTMSSDDFDAGQAIIISLNSNSFKEIFINKNNAALSPVINLKQDYISGMIGNGSKENPFRVE